MLIMENKNKEMKTPFDNKIKQAEEELEILKEGCKKGFFPYQSPNAVINYAKGICGSWQNNTFFCCDKCAEKKVAEISTLETLKEARDIFIKFVGDLKEKICLHICGVNCEKTKGVHQGGEFTDRKVGIIDKLSGGEE